MKENKLNVLSLFDGMSCGQQALERAGFNIENYFASEIDKYAIQVTMANYPNTKQLGSVVNVDGYSLPKIDLLLGGSPCQSFSFAGKRKGMSTKDEQEILTLNHYLQLKSEDYEFEGQSYLFWEYMRLLNELRTNNPNVYFLLENVEMGEKWEKVLNKAIGVKGIHINSSLVSAQNRKRIYWTNIGLEKSGLFGDYESIIKQPKDKRLLLKNILEDEVNDKYFLSEKFDNWLKKHSLKRGNEYKKTEGNRKASCLSVSALKSVNLSADFIVHNLQKRSAGRPAIQKNKNAGGSGHLCREDGKTYCLDSGNTQAVEIRKVKQLSTNNKSNGGIQPYQQDRIYDINGISPALQSQLCTGSTMLNTSKIRRLTPIECERLQTVKDNYTNYVSDSQRYKMLGNGWTIDVIAHILKYIK
jgi:DNA (cytosine-5)-methyltransferase 3A